jgi:hypothetical protein
MFHRLISTLTLIASGSSFTLPNKPSQRPISSFRAVPETETLLEPSQRDAHYGRNVAQYLVDLHDNKSTFDFCGGMMFQLSLSEKLRTHLSKVAEDGDGKDQPTIFDSSKSSMSNLEGYSMDANADNIRIFHGREIRQVPNAEGGMGFVLQLSFANGNDPEGWSPEEIMTYDGWGHDSGRTWRKANDYESEGFKTFKSTYGPKAFGLNHRCYLHLDSSNRMWLSAEDGCEGTPALPSKNLFTRLFA